MNANVVWCLHQQKWVSEGVWSQAKKHMKRGGRESFQVKCINSKERIKMRINQECAEPWHCQPQSEGFLIACQRPMHPGKMILS